MPSGEHPKQEEYPDDPRNRTAVELTEQLIATARALPADHELLRRLDAWDFGSGFIAVGESGGQMLQRLGFDSPAAFDSSESWLLEWVHVLEAAEVSDFKSELDAFDDVV